MFFPPDEQTRNASRHRLPPSGRHPLVPPGRHPLARSRRHRPALPAPAFEALVRFALTGLLALFGLFALPADALEAQWPGRIVGRLVDARSGQGVGGATVQIEGEAGSLRTDGSGRFESRGLDPGRYRVIGRQLGYADGAADVEVRNGALAHLLLELEPAALAVEEVVARALRTEPGAVRVGRERITRSGARTAGDAVLTLPGVQVVERGPGGARTLALRGSGGDQVLVLVDGAPLNDPVTGVADLSTIAASSIDELVLLRGARSARFGPRAQGGVLLIRTRTVTLRGEGGLFAGSLGERGARAGGGGKRPGGGGWSLGAQARELRGDFAFVDPSRGDDPAAGTMRRENADVRQLSLDGGAEGRLAGGELRGRFGLEALERGNPGRSFAPSRSARQDLRRGRASLTWRREAGTEAPDAAPSGTDEVTLHTTLQAVTSEDPDPPLGLPYDDETRFHASGLRVDVSRAVAERERVIVGGGVELRLQQVRSDVLEPRGTSARTEGGVFARARVRPGGAAGPEISLVARVHRDGLLGGWHAGHEATLALPAGPFSVHVAHRSAFTPPALGDHFFREGVGIAPNPELRAERVPSEWEVGFSGTLAGERATLTVGGEAYAGDVRDMIVWAPDFRFVWSPRNFDVERIGAGVWGGVRLLDERLRLDGSYGYARVTYGRGGSRPGGEPGSQLAYRPRHAGSFTLAWDASAWSASLGGRHTGLRYPVPAGINAMPPFWTFDATVSRSLRWSRWEIRSLARVDRLFDRRDSLIFGFPEPGRTLLVELRLSRAP